MSTNSLRQIRCASLAGTGTAQGPAIGTLWTAGVTVTEGREPPPVRCGRLLVSAAGLRPVGNGMLVPPPDMSGTLAMEAGLGSPDSPDPVATGAPGAEEVADDVS